MKNISRFIFNLFLSIDQMVNTLLLGHPDETLSSRLGRAKDKERYKFVKLLRILVDNIFFFDKISDKDGNVLKRHCEKSIMPLEQQNFREVADYEIWDWNI
jgi:hypothetical protein